VPHIGHSYTTVAADVIARFQRLKGRKVLFATGTDENAPKVAEAAKERGLSVREHVDEIAAKYVEAWRKLHISYDDFIRTTEPRHREYVEQFVRKLLANGDIYKGKYEAWYCMTCETYFPESEVREQRCPNEWCGRPVEWVSEENYFFRLSRYGDWLLDHITTHPQFLRPDFRGREVVAFIKDGLRDVCMSRKAYGWGIPVPGDQEQVIYVWFDALINYYTVAMTYGDGDWWPPDAHLMAKDIFPRFHATLWPAMLKSFGVELPGTVFAHGFLTINGQKFSKSLGNAIDPFALAEELRGLSGADYDVCIDAIRYFLMRDVALGQDGDFAFASLARRFNFDLANDLGNLLNRTLSMANKYMDGVIPSGTKADPEVAQSLAAAVADAGEELEKIAPHSALARLWSFVGELNTYVDREAPFRKHKDGEREAVGRILYSVLGAVRALAIAIEPFMPTVADRIRDQLGLGPCVPVWDDAQLTDLTAQWRLGSPEPIFPRIDQDRIEVAAAKFDGRPEKEPIETPKEEARMENVSFKEFQKIDLRIGAIKSAEKVAGTDKLMKFVVDLGSEERVAAAGIADQYTPEELVGKQVVFVANLEPKTIRGVDSHGMLLAAQSGEDVVLLVPGKVCVPGSKVL
jgi:methionyl-tRNA synthetase